jgi:hypothetical protein
MNILLITLDLLKIVEEIEPFSTPEFRGRGRVKSKYIYKKRVVEYHRGFIRFLTKELASFGLTK